MIHLQILASAKSEMAIKQTISDLISSPRLSRAVWVISLSLFIARIVVFFWSSESFWEIEEFIATCLVVVACAGEYFADFKPLKNWPKDEKRLAKLSTLLLISSLAFETLGQIRTSLITKDEIAVLQTARSASDLESAELKLQVARAGAETANADMDLATVYERMQWRHVRIAFEKRKQVLSKLRSVPSEAYVRNVVFSVMDPEAESYANEIADLCWGPPDEYRKILYAPTRHVPSMLSGSYNSRVPIGVCILSKYGEVDELQVILRDAGVDTTMQLLPTLPNDADVTIEVGCNPATASEITPPIR